VNVYDAAFAAEQFSVFENDRRNSRLMTRAEFKHRSALRKVFEAFIGLFRGQL
jgi:hypothetical protein